MVNKLFEKNSCAGLYGFESIRGSFYGPFGPQLLVFDGAQGLVTFLNFSRTRRSLAESQSLSARVGSGVEAYRIDLRCDELE
jgi:hypothetical protein